jgi:hypothetical protein
MNRVCSRKAYLEQFHCLDPRWPDRTHENTRCSDISSSLSSNERSVYPELDEKDTLMRVGLTEITSHENHERPTREPLSFQGNANQQN